MTKSENKNIKVLAQGIRNGNRRSISRAITLIESRLPNDQNQATLLLNSLIGETGNAMRVGISGAPGVGKSTFIEALGLELTSAGFQVAVLAVDPSSTLSGGSILGDKTRMELLSRNPSAFIRPSPSSGTLGGVARRTREAMLICEAAGFDVVIIETIGVGQSEITVADMVDTFLLLIAPGGGDELQGIKRGIVEIADLVIVNKADGALAGPAKLIASDYAGALHVLRPTIPLWEPKVLLCSALERSGIGEIWQAVNLHQNVLKRAGEINRRRKSQAHHCMWEEISEGLIDALREDLDTAPLISRLEADVGAGRSTPRAAAQVLLDAFKDGAG